MSFIFIKPTTFSITEVQSPIKETPTVRKLSERTLSQDGSVGSVRKLSQDKVMYSGTIARVHLTYLKLDSENMVL
jgi:hypothetical protein